MHQVLTAMLLVAAERGVALAPASAASLHVEGVVFKDLAHGGGDTRSTPTPTAPSSSTRSGRARRSRRSYAGCSRSSRLAGMPSSPDGAGAKSAEPFRAADSSVTVGPRPARKQGEVPDVSGALQDTEPDTAIWADDQTRQHLQVLVESVATLAGFEQSAITLRRSHDFLVLVAAGVADGFAGTAVPLSTMQTEIDRADEWGVWRFVPHERVSAEVLAYSHIPDVVPLEGDDAWHPLDMLFAPLHDDDGELRGLLSVDSPRNGRLPGPEQLAVLTEYAGVARTLVLLALERESLAEQVRMADEARRIVRRALGEPSLELVLEACRSAVTSCFGAVGMWLTAFSGDGGTSTTSYATGARSTRRSPRSTTSCSAWPAATGATSTPPTSPTNAPTSRACRPRTPPACWRSSTASASVRCCSCRSARDRSAWASSS